MPKTTSADRLADVATARIRQQIADFASTVAGGGCPDFDNYKQTTGRIKGLQDAMNIIGGALQSLLDGSADDDAKGDSLPEMNP